MRDQENTEGCEILTKKNDGVLSHAHGMWQWRFPMLGRWGRLGGIGASLALALSLSACSINQESGAFDPPLNSTFAVDAEDIILAAPDHAEREQYQLLIAQLTQILAQEKLSPERRAQMLYQLGLLYDRMGMDVTARTMFMGSLIAVPDYAQAYNFLGIYFASAERFSEAYDAYDAALEIDPEETFAYFNRGIALYYGNRAQLGLQDLLKFYDFDHNDPFRIAWLYILERTVHGEDYAHQHLEERRNAIEGNVPWGLEVLDFFLGKINSHQVINAIREANLNRVELNRRLCEAYFYMGKQADFAGDYKLAYDFFQLCLATNVTGYLEFRYALLEIDRYERQEMVAKADQMANAQQAEREAYLKKQAEEAQKYFEQLDRQGQFNAPLAHPDQVQPQEQLAPESDSESASDTAEQTETSDGSASKAEEPSEMESNPSDLNEGMSPVLNLLQGLDEPLPPPTVEPAEGENGTN